MKTHANPFAPLIDPASVLAACATSETLGALRTHAYHRADRPSDKVSQDLAEFDAAIDAAVAISPPRRASSRRRRRSESVEREPDCAAPVSDSLPASVTPPHAGVEPTVVPSSTGGRAVPDVPATTEERPHGPWWSASLSLYLRMFTPFGMFATPR